MSVYVKDPDAVLDYKVDWADWLAATGDAIVTSTWLVPAGVTKTDEDNTTATATIWLSGGTAGSSYQVTNRVTTTQGRTDDRTIQIIVRDR